ncbi:winged helix-turn-helix domain-containing protein [Vibrio sinaloensis]|nr:winged helix-turn-helix domain-containing protein [Vibrio sinaloensis]
MLVINGTHLLNPDQGFIQSLNTHVRHPIGINEITLLNYMIERKGETLTKDEIMHEVWLKRGIVVESSSLLHCISNCRRALEDKAAMVIRTVRGIGYEFVARIEPFQELNAAEETQEEQVESAVEQIEELATEPASQSTSMKQWALVAGLVLASAGLSYALVEKLHSPIQTASFEQQHYSQCTFFT